MKRIFGGEDTYTREIHIEKFPRKMEEHSTGRFTELPGRALDHTYHVEGGLYSNRGGMYNICMDFVLLTSSCMDLYF